MLPLLPHSTYFIRQFLVLVLFVGYCFGEIMCIWDNHVYRKGVLCFLIHKSHVRSIKSYCFVRKYAAIPVQLEIFILQYIGWCVLIWTLIFNQFGFFFLLLLLYLLRLLRWCRRRYKYVNMHDTIKTNRSICCSRNTLDSYSGDSQFESRRSRWLFSLLSIQPLLLNAGVVSG